MNLVRISTESFQEAKNIFEGVYYPLTGFLDKSDLISVLDNMRLVSGGVWPMPILLDTDDKLGYEGEATLIDSRGNKVILKNASTYKFPKKEITKKLFNTDSIDHPGVARVMVMKEYLLSGIPTEIELKTKDCPFYLSPKETRGVFRDNQWDEVVGFQTRNPPHVSHEHIQKLALKKVDAIMIHPIMGEKKPGDFLDKHIINSYRVLIEKYYKKSQVHFGTFYTFMRYAGPKEALFHALVRRNFGCTHMIIGRDHAGVGDYYGPYDAHRIFDDFDETELGVKVFKFDNTAYCPVCKDMKTDKDCVHEKIYISGTRLREMLQRGNDIDEHFMRREVSNYLLENKDNLFV